MIWHVYLLSCRGGALYCGITTNLERRLAQHNGELAGGARYTRGRRPAKLLASKTCADKSQALRLEARIKGLPRGKKLDFLESFGNESAQ